MILGGIWVSKMSQKVRTKFDHLCLFPKLNSIMIKTLQRRSLTQSSRFASSQSSDKRHLNVEQYYWARGTGWARWEENSMVKTEKISFQ